MIPRTLELKNFLSYGEPLQKIDLTPYNMICLSGKNGNGKSAMLDAITWAIWGQARKTASTSKADEGLLHLGKTRMLVSLEWESNGKLYRVRREYAKTHGKPYAALDFELFNPTEQKFISLTDKTIRQTQENIDVAVGLDFETFINSAFIRQGQSNEFSKKTPKERKTILASILGLDRYDKLQQKALAKVRELDQTIMVREQLYKQQELELAHQTTLQQQREELAASLRQATLTTEQETASLQRITTQLQTNKTLCARYEALHEQHAARTTQQAHKKEELHDLVTSWRTTHAALLAVPNLQEIERERTALEAQVAQLHKTQQTLLQTEHSLQETQQHYHTRHALLTSQAQAAMHTAQLAYTKILMQHEQAKKELALCINDEQTKNNELATLTRQHNELTKIIAAQAQQQELTAKTRQQFEKRKQFYHTLLQRGTSLTSQCKELEHKQSITINQHNPACPLCEQMLTAQRKKFLVQQLSKQDTTLRHRLQRITTIVKKLKQLLVEQHQELEKATAQEQLYTQQQHTLATINQRILELTALQLERAQAVHTQQNTVMLLAQELTHAEHAQKTIAASNNTLTNDAELQQLATTQQLLITNKQALNKELALYQPTLTKLQECTALHTRILTLAAAREQQPQRRKTIDSLIRDLRLFKTLNAQAEQEAREYTILKTEQTTLTTLITEQQTQIAQTSLAKEEIGKALSICDDNLKRLAAMADAHATQREAVTKLKTEKQQYEILATAFGKNGMQALLIEEAIPELEQEANALLAALTDNQAQLFIESLRDLKNGGVRETLDIKIADAAGIRPYELFSGGEAFRVDFALRIAISKLLARRAGTALQTLIIDEGFGSQDEEGLARIMQALYAIQKDFAKIIIVSHLAEFKENFAVHFLVEKTPTGSQITVEERG